MTKLPPNVLALLQNQLTAERHAHAAYSSLAASLYVTPYRGIAALFYEAANEEISHFRRIFEYLADRGEAPVIGAVEAATVDASSPIAAFQSALKLEMAVTQMLNGIAKAAGDNDNGDPATCEFLLYFVKEQAESEATLQHFIDRLTLAASDPCALLVVDKEAHDLAFKGK